METAVATAVGTEAGVGETTVAAATVAATVVVATVARDLAVAARVMASREVEAAAETVEEGVEGMEVAVAAAAYQQA